MWSFAVRTSRLIGRNRILSHRAISGNTRSRGLQSFTSLVVPIVVALWMAPLTAVRAEVLTFAADTRYACDTYRWWLGNTQQVQLMFQDGQRAPSLDRPGGAGTSHVLEAWSLQADAKDTVVALVDTAADHLQRMHAVVEATAPRAIIREYLTGSSRAAEAIELAANEGAHVINLPFGLFSSSSNRIYDAISHATNALVVYACPNDSGDYDAAPEWPSSWGLFNLISVTGMDISENPVFSHSTNHFDLCAPAYRLQVTDRFYANGNSYACAIVAATAALVRQHYPGLGPIATRAKILGGVDVHPQYAKHCRTSGCLNAYRAVAPQEVVLSIWQASELLGAHSNIMEVVRPWSPTERFYGIDIRVK